MKYGYCRCSTNETKQDIDRQIRALKEAGAEVICFEYEHGDAEHKKELEKLLDKTVPGDTILTMEVSRLARSTKQLCGLIDIVKEKRLRLEILGSITVDWTAGELELSMTRARVNSGMANARAKGAAIGRPKTTLDDLPVAFLKFFPAYKSGNMTAIELARVSGIGRTTLYKYLKIATCV